MVEILPGIEENPFPNGYISTGIEDKLFKHVLFQTDKKLSKFRIKSIGHDWTELLEATTGELKIPLVDWDFTKNKVRIKAVLKEAQYGVQESDWVSQQVLGEVKKRKLNQFRVRGVTNKGMRSRWVYSELKDEDNDLVVFQLLHDILDIMTTVHEHDLTAIIESSLYDTLIGLMNGGRMDDVKWLNTLFLDDETKYALTESIETTGMGSHQLELFKGAGVSEKVFNELMRDYLAFKEEKKVKVVEAAELVARHFKKNFMEQKKFSAEEIALHAKLYNLNDSKNDEILDHMLEHLFLLTVEDAYEKAIEECNLVALLQNDEELLLLLTDAYNFKAESTLIDVFANVEFIENFVTFFGDGLSLLLEPSFDETKVSQIVEEAVPVLLLMYRDIYIPLVLLDTTIAELFADLEDDVTSMHNKLNAVLGSVKYEIYDESTGEIWTLVEEFLVEIFEYLLLTDDHMEKEIFVDLFSRMIGTLKTDSLKMLITYDPVEAVQFITQLLENVNATNTTAQNTKTEKYNLHLAENIAAKDLINNEPTEDAQKLTKLEDVLLKDSSIYVENGEIFTLRNGESYTMVNLNNFRKILENYILLLEEGYTIEDIFSNKDIFLKYNLGVLSDVKNEDMTKNIHFIASHYVAILQSLILNNTVGILEGDYRVPAYASYHLELLYKTKLTDLFTGPFMRRESEEEFEVAEMFPIFDRYDDYFSTIWNIKEDVHVHLGELDLIGTRFPLGYFVLGTNTLEGESNTL